MSAGGRDGGKQRNNFVKLSVIRFKGEGIIAFSFFYGAIDIKKGTAQTYFLIVIRIFIPISSF